VALYKQQINWEEAKESTGNSEMDNSEAGADSSEDIAQPSLSHDRRIKKEQTKQFLRILARFQLWGYEARPPHREDFFRNIFTQKCSKITSFRPM